MNIPDYISPVIGYRVWGWNATGLKSLNGEPWLLGRPLAAGCRAAARGTIVGRAKAVHGAHDLPHSACTCGVYAAKNLEHLRQFGYEGARYPRRSLSLGNSGVAQTWVRAQFAYPKSLFLPPDAVPFTLTEIDARLKTLIAFGTDIFTSTALILRGQIGAGCKYQPKSLRRTVPATAIKPVPNNPSVPGSGTARLVVPRWMPPWLSMTH